MSGGLDEHLARVMDAAKREGIQPDTPLGAWHAAVVDLTQGLDRRLGEALAQTRAAAEAQLATAEAAARRSEAVTKGAEVKAEQAIASMAEKVAPLIADTLGKAVVIRERTRERWITLGYMAAGGGALLAAFCGGLWVKAIEVRPAVALQNRCLTAAVQGTDGGTYCPLVPPRAASKGR